MLQAHAIQVQTLQNELDSLRAQLANLKNKSSKPIGHAQPVQGSRSREGPPRSFYGLSHDAMVGEYVLSNAHNSGLTPEFVFVFVILTSWHNRLMWHLEFLPLSK